MLAGVSVTCFAASYAVALLLEATRLWFRSGVRGMVLVGFAAAGFLAHTLFLGFQAARHVRCPLSNERDWYLLTAWGLAAVYLYLTCSYRRTSFGLVLLPLVLGLVAAAVFWADPEPFPAESALTVWGAIHGTSILLATVAVLIGFAAGVMYLRQSYRLKHKRPPGGCLRLPSLEWLGRATSRSLVIAVLMLGVGVLSGVLLNWMHQPAQVPWSDPVVLSTLAMFGWLALSIGAGFFYRPTREGRKVAYFTVVGFLFLILALGVGLFAPSRHRRPRHGLPVLGVRCLFFQGDVVCQPTRHTASSNHGSAIAASGVREEAT